MKLHGRQISDILEKPLDLVTEFIIGLAGGRSSSSKGGPQGGHYSPSPSTHSPITSNPLVPAFLLLTVGLLLSTVTPLGSWLGAAQNSPTLDQIFSFSRKKRTRGLPNAAEAISVWTKRDSGFYYCKGGTLFGNKPGEMMTQAEALMSGYRPANRTYCANSLPEVAAANRPDFKEQETPPVANRSPSVAKSSVLFTAGQTGNPGGVESVKVWGIKPFGLYYCRGDALFGTGPGRLMTESAALKAGLEATGRSCAKSNRNEESATNSYLESQLPSVAGDVSHQAKMPMEASSKDSPGSPNANDAVSVWVINQFGFYYCQNDVLFGNKPGQMMTQAKALAEGYQPSDGRCASGKQTRAAPGSLLP